MGGFLADVNTVENTKVNSIIHQAYPSIGLWKESIPRAYRWLGSQFTFPVIIEHLSKYPFLHTDKAVLGSHLVPTMSESFRDLASPGHCL